MLCCYVLAYGLMNQHCLCCVVMFWHHGLMNQYSMNQCCVVMFWHLAFRIYTVNVVLLCFGTMAPTFDNHFLFMFGI